MVNCYASTSLGCSFSLNEDITVVDFSQADVATSLFALPLSEQAFQELDEVNNIMQSFVTDSAVHDVRTSI